LVSSYWACGILSVVRFQSPHKDATACLHPLFLSPSRTLLGGGKFQREWVADFSENGWQISAITGGKFQREYTDLTNRYITEAL